jgi:hypothetical protein
MPKPKQIIENGKCQHFIIVGQRTMWSLEDECHFCGTGKEWE